MDSLLLSERNISGTQTMLGVVCDGVGSLSDGAYASVESVRMLSEWFQGLNDTQRVGLRMRDEVLLVNTKITEAANEQNKQTATTLSALLIADNHIHIVHAGDSRIYSISDNSAQLLTVDAVTESGHLTTFVGRHFDLELFYSEAVIDDTTFLLCSDGFYKRINISEDPVRESIFSSNKKTISKTLNSLADMAVERGERDNISAAIIKILM
jgi:serine/threonine protein phosphatase PrpC